MRTASITSVRSIVNGNDDNALIAGLARYWEGQVADLVTEVQRSHATYLETPAGSTPDADAPLERGDVQQANPHFTLKTISAM